MNFLPAAKVRVMDKKPFPTDKISNHTTPKTLGKEEVKTSKVEARELARTGVPGDGTIWKFRLANTANLLTTWAEATLSCVCCH
jgi:hypothetical protein